MQIQKKDAFLMNFHNMPLLAILGAISVNATLGRNIGKLARLPSHRLTFSPASWAFSIWGVIYATMIIVCLAEVTFKTWNNHTIVFFTISCVLNSAWVVAWSSSTALSTCILYALCASLFMMWQSNSLQRSSPGSLKTTQIVQNCISMYLAWTIGAALLNTSIAMKQYTTISSKLLSRGALIVFCLIQVAWLYTFHDRISECIPVAFVGIWFCAAIVSRGGADSGIWKIGIVTILLTTALMHGWRV